jgi:hypothetical protein
MSKRILVVEDQADNRQIIRDMLARSWTGTRPRAKLRPILQCDSNYRSDLLCAQRRGEEGTRGGL